MIGYYVIVIRDVGCIPDDWYKALDEIDDVIDKVKEYTETVARNKTLVVTRFFGREIDSYKLEHTIKDIQRDYMIEVSLFSVDRSWTWKK